MNELEKIRAALIEARSQVRDYRQWNKKTSEGWKNPIFTGQAKVEADKNADYHVGCAAGLEYANFRYQEIIEMIDEMLDEQKEEKK